MNFTAMSALIIFIFCAADVLPRVLEKAGFGKWKAAYFALCVWVMRIFEIKFLPEFTLNISVIIVFVCCALLETFTEEKKTLKTLPVIIFCSAFNVIYNMNAGENEAAVLFISLLTALFGLVSGGLISAFACSAAVPVFSAIIKFIAELCIYNYGTLEFTGNTVDAQMTGLVFAAVLYEIYMTAKNHIGKKKILTVQNEPAKNDTGRMKTGKAD